MIGSDGELVRAARDGDADAFGHLVHAYQGRLFGLVLMMVREPAGAEDVTQETLIRAYRFLDDFDVERPFYPWLAAIAVRLSQNWLRQHGRIASREGASLDQVREPQSTDALHELISDEQGRRLWHAVATLPSGERTAATMYYRDEMSVGDIALALGVTSGTIKTLLSRARRRLRGRLDHD